MTATGARTLAGSETLMSAARGKAQVAGCCRTCGVPCVQCRCEEADAADVSESADADFVGLQVTGPALAPRMQAPVAVERHRPHVRLTVRRRRRKNLVAQGHGSLQRRPQSRTSTSTFQARTIAPSTYKIGT